MKNDKATHISKDTTNAELKKMAEKEGAHPKDMTREEVEKMAKDMGATVMRPGDPGNKLDDL